MTFLEIVNKVLIKLREDKVSSVDYTDYSTLIGEFVNDAKKEVESRWTWSAMKSVVAVNSVATSRVVDLTEWTTEDSVLIYDECERPMVFDVGRHYGDPWGGSWGTSWGISWQGADVGAIEPAIQLYEYQEETLARQYHISNLDNTQQIPMYFTLAQKGNGFQMNFLETPSESRNYLLYFYVPQEELVGDNETIRIPWRPVRDLALLYALDERGEEIGEPGSKAWLRYENALRSAIQIDAVRDPNKNTFKVI